MSEWISVKERLPEKEQLFVVCWANAEMGFKGPFMGVLSMRIEGSNRDRPLSAFFIENEGDFLEDWFDDEDYVPPTHWMPLPEPPETDK